MRGKNSFKWKGLLFACMWIASIGMFAQNLTVKGTITDVGNEPVIGVTITLQDNASYGTVTDIDGNYELTNVPRNAVLKFSYIGMITESIPVNGRTTIDVVLRSATEELDELVVVGYGVTKKVNLTASVSTINFEREMEGRPLVNISSSLAGMAAGLGVMQTSAQPGAESTTIRIRGNNTLNANSPLVLVDGVEWSLDQLNPNDIANISVLKDASATAIYGSRAANGVVLVTTKKGSGKAKISYSFSGIAQNAINKLKFVDDYATHMELVNEAADNIGTARIFSPATIEDWRMAKENPNEVNENGIPNWIAYPNTNWFDEIFSTGYSSEHNVSVSGAGEKTSYLISLGYLDNKGVMNRFSLNSGTEKVNFRTNIETKVNTWLKVGTKLFGQRQGNGLANISNAFNYLYQTTPGIYPGTPNFWGVPANVSEESSNANNILGQMRGSGGHDTYYRMNASVYGIVSPVKNLEIEGSFNYSPQFRDRHVYSVQNGYWDYVKDTRMRESALENASVTNQFSQIQRYNTDLIARYNTVYKEDHEIGGLVGFSSSSYFSNGFSTQKKGATSWTLHDLDTFSELVNSSSSAAAQWGLTSLFGRVNYAYKSRYLLEANVRYDGSSRFASQGRWGVFPSFSGAWRILEEDFMENVRPVMSNLKLRASWGKTGNNQVGNYAWQGLYNTKNVVTDGSPTVGLIQTQTGNSALRWESTTSSNIGFDYGFFDNKLTGEIDAYQNITDGILFIPAQQPVKGNITGATENIAVVQNRGAELTLGWRDKIGKDFHYHLNGNVSFSRSIVTKYKGELQKYWEYDEDGNKVKYINNQSDVATGGFGGLIVEGHTLGETNYRKMYRGTGSGFDGDLLDLNAGPVDGMIRTESDMEWVKAMLAAGFTFDGKNRVSKDQLWYGDFLYADSNEDGNYGDSNDMNLSGRSSQPKFYFGFNTGFSWKGVDFSMQWAGAAGFYLLWNTSYYNNTQVSNGHGITQRIANDHYFYDPENPDDPRTNINGTYPRITLGTSNGNSVTSQWYEYKGDYLKMKNMQIGYTLPSAITEKIFIERVRIYGSGENLLTITSYPGLDPEIGTNIGYPLMRQFAIGAQITF